MEERLYTFQCPMCQKKFTYNQPAEPLCDGPKDVKEHEPAVMRLVHIKTPNRQRNVGGVEAEQRARGTILIPDNLIDGNYRVNGELWYPHKDDPEYDRLIEKRQKKLEELGEA